MHVPRIAPDSSASTQTTPVHKGADAKTFAKHPPKVLVAEDDEDIRFMMKTLLGMRGYTVVEARDGQETVDVARAERPDIILMDLQLPRLNGFAVARFVRQDECLHDVPIVIVTGHDPAKHRNLALAAGCNAYVLKPINFDQLGELIVSLLPQD
jgi:two-component system, cell cycle response regulator DivK